MGMNGKATGKNRSLHEQTFGVYFINLLRRPDRLARISNELGRAGLIANRVDAVDGQQLDQPKSAVLLTNGQKACWESHRRAWKTFLSTSKSFALILEDDAVFSPKISTEYLGDLIMVMEANGVALLQIGFIESQYRNDTLGNLSSLRNSSAVRLSGRRELVTWGQFRAGSHAYLLSREAAGILDAGAACSLTPIDEALGNLARYYRGSTDFRAGRLYKSQVQQESRKPMSLQLDSDIED